MKSLKNIEIERNKLLYSILSGDAKSIIYIY